MSAAPAAPAARKTLNIPEVTVKMHMSIMGDKLVTDVDWMRDGNAVCRYFTDSAAFENSDGCLTAYSVVALPAQTIAGQLGAAVPERVLRFPATQLSVSEEQGVHAMRLVWCVGGAKPVDEKSLSGFSAPLPAGQCQPVIFAELSLAQLFTGEVGRMTIGKVPMATGAPAVMGDLFDILHTNLATCAPENASAHALVDVGVRHTALSLASKEDALELHAKFHISSEAVSAALAKCSAQRQAECHELLLKFTDKKTDEQCNMAMVTLTTGSEVFDSKKVDWAQWSAGVDAHNGFVLGMLVPELANACIEVGHALATASKLPGPDGMLQAIRQTDSDALTTKLHEEINMQVSAAAHYAFDTSVEFNMDSVTTADRLSVYPTISPSGENQNPSGYPSRCTLLVNQKTLMPLKAALEVRLGQALGSVGPDPAAHTHKPYYSLSRESRAAMLDLSRLKQKLNGEGDCEDYATKNMVTFNAVFPLAAGHHAAVEIGRPSELQGHLAAYAATHPELAAYMPAVQHAVLSAASTGRRLECALVLASGAKLEAPAAGKVAHAPHPPPAVSGPTGVYAQIEQGMAAGQLAGHCVAVEARQGALELGHPAHAALVDLKAQGKCAGFSLSDRKSVV